MKHKAQIKKIYKQDKPPFGDGILTYKIQTTKHTGYYYNNVAILPINEGDEVEYDYVQQKNGDYKFKDLKKASMYNNYTKDKDIEYINKQDNKEDNIHFQSARRDFAISNQGRGLSAQEIHEGALEIYRLHKQIKHKL